MPLGCLAALFGIREKPAAARETRVPTSLPLNLKRYFFSRDEKAFFGTLEGVLRDTPYRVFPNVRLDDLFEVQKAAPKGTRNRIQNKHVDFLLVDARDAYRPVLAIELDGRSHERVRQQHRDAVKDVAFKSAGLKLLRLSSRAYRAAELREVLGKELRL
ncbi:DUF2726 domain-containing protein [Deinococcus hopiensis]|uniref:DUF2726 domain-containing protein n=1 Tax=Deinococcus hopiensis KR-140 TaxID=695939 RepID=A0A1W1VFZ5_9DEIO|nr:DUF2726 domain-containing protein [Deinococcus hopiensis]SMB91884.1 Protein of unknown function [Deinococcus hopiensis KR-140]